MCRHDRIEPANPSNYNLLGGKNMKRIPSIALALALCLSLTVPACAANQSDNTAITDSIGNTYTLSNSVLYTLHANKQKPSTEVP